MYPSRIYHLLFLRDLKLDRNNSKFSYNGIEVKLTEMMGMIVSVKEKYNLFEFHVDDGTGTLKCTMFKNGRYDQEPLDIIPSTEGLKGLLDLIKPPYIPVIGDYVHIFGRLYVKGEHIGVICKSLRKVTNTEEWFTYYSRIELAFIENKDNPNIQRVDESKIDLENAYIEPYVNYTIPELSVVKSLDKWNNTKIKVCGIIQIIHHEQDGEEKAWLVDNLDKCWKVKIDLSCVSVDEKSNIVMVLGDLNIDIEDVVIKAKIISEFDPYYTNEHDDIMEEIRGKFAQI